MSNVCNYLGRVTGFAVQMIDAPEVKAILPAVQGGLIISYGGLQMAEAFSEAAGKARAGRGRGVIPRPLPDPRGPYAAGRPADTR